MMETMDADVVSREQKRKLRGKIVYCVWLRDGTKLRQRRCFRAVALPLFSPLFSLTRCGKPDITIKYVTAIKKKKEKPSHTHTQKKKS